MERVAPTPPKSMGARIGDPRPLALLHRIGRSEHPGRKRLGLSLRTAIQGSLCTFSSASLLFYLDLGLARTIALLDFLQNCCAGHEQIPDLQAHEMTNCGELKSTQESPFTKSLSFRRLVLRRRFVAVNRHRPKSRIWTANPVVATASSQRVPPEPSPRASPLALITLREPTPSSPVRSPRATGIADDRLGNEASRSTRSIVARRILNYPYPSPVLR